MTTGAFIGRRDAQMDHNIPELAKHRNSSVTVTVAPVTTTTTITTTVAVTRARILTTAIVSI